MYLATKPPLRSINSVQLTAGFCRSAGASAQVSTSGRPILDDAVRLVSPCRKGEAGPARWWNTRPAPNPTTWGCQMGRLPILSAATAVAVKLGCASRTADNREVVGGFRASAFLFGGRS
jgi:hypothetical protein